MPQQLNDERYTFFEDAGALGDSLNDLEFDYWQTVRGYTGRHVNDLRRAWEDDGSPAPSPPLP